jgi:hypothetical protein
MDKNEAVYSRFRQLTHITFETMRDPDWTISHSFGTYQLPETYVIVPSGKVAIKIVAAYNFMNADFVDQIQKMLAASQARASGLRLIPQRSPAFSPTPQIPALLQVE